MKKLTLNVPSTYLSLLFVLLFLLEAKAQKIIDIAIVSDGSKQGNHLIE
jgi:hypothetical protein